MMQRKDIYKALDEERDYQRRRWGKRDEDGKITEKWHSIPDYIVYMSHYLGNAMHKAAMKSEEQGGKKDMLDCLRKVVTLGVACFEQHGIPKRGKPAKVTNGHDRKPA